MKTDYDLLVKQLQSIFEDETDQIAILSNASAILNMALEDINWVGFYLIKDGELILGPFQGKVACMHIKIGSGVCGSAVKENCTLVVKNVHEFAGHIACDSASNSEIVVPIRKNGEVIGVLDIDSPSYERFDSEDQQGLEACVRILEDRI